MSDEPRFAVWYLRNQNEELQQQNDLLKRQKENLHLRLEIQNSKLDEAKTLFDRIDAEGGHGIKLHEAIREWRLKNG